MDRWSPFQRWVRVVVDNKIHQPGWREGGKCGATPVKVQSLGSSNTFHILLACPEQEVHYDPLQPVPPLLKWYLHCSLFTVSDCHCQHCFLLETGDERIRRMIGVADLISSCLMGQDCPYYMKCIHLYNELVLIWHLEDGSRGKTGFEDLNGFFCSCPLKLYLGGGKCFKSGSHRTTFMNELTIEVREFKETLQLLAIIRDRSRSDGRNHFWIHGRW